jgi:DNA-binding FadR family transcriptional regulator
MEEAYTDMQRASQAEDAKALIEADLRFHLHLLELSGNSVLVEHGRRLLIPLFAFVLMARRNAASGSYSLERNAHAASAHP